MLFLDMIFLTERQHIITSILLKFRSKESSMHLNYGNIELNSFKTWYLGHPNSHIKCAKITVGSPSHV